MSITPEQQQSIASLLANMTLPKGIGSTESACSIAAINLALTGELTDEVPPCMSEVIGRWIIRIQDAMPAEMRNSEEWKRLLPLAAGTGRDHEQERLAIIMEWIWEVLQAVQPVADANGFGNEWRVMLRDRTAAAADAAAGAAANRARAAARAAADAAAAHAAANAAANAAHAAANAAAAHAARAAAYAAAHAARAAAYAAANAADAAARAADAAIWQQINPCGLLQRLINL